MSSDDREVDTSKTEENEVLAAYRPECRRLPAFDLCGFTKIVASGGEQYGEVRADGRWQVLRDVAGDDGTIYGVATHDKDAPEGSYRYTLAVKASEDRFRDAGHHDGLYSIHIEESEWIVFTIDSFSAQYGKLWQDNPYELIRKLGWSFNRALSLHIDAFPASYSSDDDAMEFMMPVTRPASA